MSFFASSLASPPPDAAIEIAADRVSVAVVARRGHGLAVQSCASIPLPAGTVVGSLTSTNILNPPAVADVLRTALDRAGVRPRRVALVIPDVAAKAALVRFDTVPSRREDLDQLVRWHVRKASPFPIEEASVTFTPGLRAADGSTEFLVVTARRAVIAEYESVCAEVKAYAGLVDLATLSVINFFLGSSAVPAGDWLVVYLRPDYTTIVVMRGADVIFFRNRPEGDEDAIADLVHQTAMYYQDRLAGQGFIRAFLGGNGRGPRATEAARRSLEERLGVAVDPIDPTSIAAFADRISVSPEVIDTLTPLVGMMLRTYRDTVAV